MSWRAPEEEPPAGVSPHEALRRLGALVDRKAELTRALIDADEAALDAGGIVDDAHDSEEQRLLRAALYEVDVELEQAGVL